MEFRSRAVRSLVELHEAELRRFLDVWDRFLASGAPLPEPHGDPDYEDRARLVSHVLTAARGYLIRIGECVKRPVADVDAEQDPRRIAPRARGFAEGVLAAWRQHLVHLADAELGPQTYVTRWGDDLCIEAMLEHAVVHPMRHRIQLERILA